MFRTGADTKDEKHVLKKLEEKREEENAIDKSWKEVVEMPGQIDASVSAVVLDVATLDAKSEDVCQEPDAKTAPTNDDSSWLDLKDHNDS